MNSINNFRSTIKTAKNIQKNKSLNFCFIAHAVIIFQGPIVSLMIKNGAGDQLTILPDHSPIMTTVPPQHFCFKPVDGSFQTYKISQGIFSIGQGQVEMITNTGTRI